MFIRNRQLCTALCTTACQHFSAIGRLHAFPETMNGFTAAGVGLECTFHCLKVFSQHIYLLNRQFSILFQGSPGYPAEREAKVTHSGFTANKQWDLISNQPKNNRRSRWPSYYPSGMYR